MSALKILSGRKISLIILDLTLPDADGRNLLVTMRELPSAYKIPVIVLSGRTETTTKTECFALGAMVYFEKPFDADTLAAAVSSSLQFRADLSIRDNGQPQKEIKSIKRQPDSWADRLKKKLSIGSYLTFGQWGRRGGPEYLTQEPLEISDEQMTTINNIFRERVDLTNAHADFFDEDNVRNTVLTEGAEVFVSFVNETAGWRNALGFYTYQSDDPPESIDDVSFMTVIFPNVSYRGGGELNRGDRVNISQIIGEFSAGTSIGYFLVAQGWDSRRYEVTDGLYRHNTDIEFNDEVEADISQQHVLVWDEDNEAFVLAFEDTRRDSWLCDKDFNEAILLITSDPPGAIDTDDVPELSE